MSSVCEICGAADPKWLRWVDQDVGDYFARTMTGMPGRNAHAAHYCEDPECAAAIEARYGPQGNQSALNRLTDELGAKGLDADDNEVRLMALCAQLLRRGGA
jgi:hypothetical protein